MKKLLLASTLLVLSSPAWALEVTHPFYLPEQGGVASFTTADYRYQNVDKSNMKSTAKTLKEEIAVGLTDTVSLYGNISNTWLDLREPPYTRSFNDNTEWNVGAKWNIVQQCCWFVQARGAFGIAHDDISSGDRQSITAGLSAGYQFGSVLGYVKADGNFPVNEGKEDNEFALATAIGAYGLVADKVALDGSFENFYDKEDNTKDWTVRLGANYLFTEKLAVGLFGRYLLHGSEDASGYQVGVNLNVAF